MRQITFVLVGAPVVAMAGFAQGTVFLSDDFESYGTQAAFDAVWTPNTTAAVYSTEQSVSPTHSVKGLTTATRSLRTIGELGLMNATTDFVHFQVKYFDSDATLNPYRQYAELDDTTAPSGSGQLYAIGLNNNLLNSAGAGPRYMARILGADGGSGVSAFFKLDAPGAPARSTGWHQFDLYISDNTARYLVDGIISKTVDISAVTDRSLDTVKLGSNLSSTAVAYFDDVLVERVATPEPGTLALLGMASVVMARRRK